MPPRPTAMDVLRPVLAALTPVGLMAALAPSLPLEGRAAFLVAFAAVTLTIVGGLSAAPSGPQPRRVALVAVAAGVALVAVALRLPPVASGFAGSLGLLAIAWALGGAIGSRMEAPGHLAAVALVSAAVDLWSVTSPSGPTNHIVRSPALVRLLTVSVAVPPLRAPQSMVGVGDAVFVALYLAAAERFALSRGRTAAALAAGIVASGLLAMALERPVPALPLMGLMVLVTQPRARDVPAADRRATMLAAAMLIASVARALTR